VQASPELRKQLAWLGYAGVLTVLWILVLAPGWPVAVAQPMSAPPAPDPDAVSG